MNKENKQNELPLCWCGCGERVTKPGNRFIQYHYKAKIVHEYVMKIDKKRLKEIKKERERENRILNHYCPKKRNLLWTIILWPIKTILLCIWWTIKIVFSFFFASFIMGVTPILYVIIVGLLQVFAFLIAFGLIGLLLWLRDTYLL